MGRNIDYTSDYGQSPFCNQHVLTDVRFSQAGTVTYCKDKLLYKVNNCASLTLPESLASIGNGTFEGMSKLRSIVIPNSVTAIGYSAFEDDTALESVRLSTSCPYLPKYMFSGCSGLKIITIPAVVNKMGDKMFTNCVNVLRPSRVALMSK